MDRERLLRKAAARGKYAPLYRHLIANDPVRTHVRERAEKSKDLHYDGRSTEEMTQWKTIAFR